ncbi:MAG: hypothetical protein EOO52_08180 [Gammaproteobacteria bacterium]|nr:MAG: hypothetical protein EOO52_08180 [Gammaproteobacteria bacterium]
MRLILFLMFFYASAAESLMLIEPVSKKDMYFQSKIGNDIYRFNEVAISGHEKNNFIEVSGITVFKAELIPNQGNDSEGCQVSETAEPLSFVGNIVSMKRNTGQYCKGMAHYNHSIVIEVFKIDDVTLKKVYLNEIFSDEEIVSNILSDRYFNTIFPDIKNIDLLVNSEFYNDVVLQRFAFHHLKNGRVAVRIYIPNDALSEQIVLGIYLTPRNELMESLRNSKKAGLLLENIEKLME